MKRLILVTIILFSINIAFTQNWRLRSNTYFTWSSDLPLRYVEGISVSGFYCKNVGRKKDQVYGGLSFNSNSWANHILAKIGYSHEHKMWNFWSLTQDIEIGNGVALFNPNPLFTFDFQTTVYMNYHTSKNNVWGVGLGMHRIVTPGYKTFIPLNKQDWNVNLSLRYAF